MNVRIKEEDKIRVLNSDDIFSIMQKILLRENKIRRDKEHFWIIGLANNYRILFIELISLGTVNMSVVHPMEVFSFALQKRAVKLILAHNHPSGDLIPSKDDKDVTNRLLQNSLFLEVPIIDHIILSEITYYSFTDSGLLEKLSRSKKYVTAYKQEEDRLKELGKKEGIEIGEQRGEERGVKKGLKEKAVEMARAMKKDKRPIEEIQKYTELSPKEIKSL